MSEPICFSLFAQFNGLNGFLGYRGSLMLDVVFLAMFAVVPVMFWSIYQVRYHRRYALHKTTQLILAAVLLVAVTLFEIEMRINGWMDRAVPSRFWRDGRWNDWIDFSLAIHLACAIPTALLWIFVVVRALRQFPRPPQPGEHSRSHIFWARLAAIELFLTAVTGCVFYVLAFVA
ncbi:MAG: DUF420 domain-containing protein [Planctomycetaceae bacterium]|nr:DUF420 domain-containing protein [Planctomycetaceae bacterium]